MKPGRRHGCGRGRLEDEGQVVSESINGERVYKLTEAGRARTDSARRNGPADLAAGAAPWILIPPKSEARSNGWSKLRSVWSRASRRRRESSACVKSCCARCATLRDWVARERADSFPTSRFRSPRMVLSYRLDRKSPVGLWPRVNGAICFLSLAFAAAWARSRRLAARECRT
jgi:hypothetical protein